MTSPGEVVRFWRDAGPKAWFAKDETFDGRCRAFEKAHHAAARILCRIEPNVPPIRGDRRMIERIFIDLLDHLAVLAGLECEFVISVKLAADRGAELEIFANQQANDRFQPTAAANTVDLPEVPLVRALVDLHGGQLTMTNRGHGALYARVVLPAWRTLAAVAE